MYDLDNIQIKNTGSKFDEDFILKQIPFENYQVTIKFDKNHNFIGIEEISINERFYNYKEIIKRKIQYKIREPSETELKEIEK